MTEVKIMTVHGPASPQVTPKSRTGAHQVITIQEVEFDEELIVASLGEHQEAQLAEYSGHGECSDRGQRIKMTVNSASSSSSSPYHSRPPRLSRCQITLFRLISRFLSLDDYRNPSVIRVSDNVFNCMSLFLWVRQF